MLRKGAGGGLGQMKPGGKAYLMASLVALSFTVEEKEECVLSSKRKDRIGFARSE